MFKKNLRLNNAIENSFWKNLLRTVKGHTQLHAIYSDYAKKTVTG